MGKEARYIQYSIDAPLLWTAIDRIILLQGAKSTQFPGQRSLTYQEELSVNQTTRLSGQQQKM